MTATTVEINTLVDSEIKTIIRANVLGGTLGDIANYVIYNPALYLNKGTAKLLVRVQATLDGFTGLLKWGNATTGKSLLTFPEDHYVDFKFDTGLSNREVTGKTGTITLTTFNIGDGDSAIIILSIINQDKLPGVP